MLLCWRGTIPREAFEIIVEDGHVVARELPDAVSNQRFAPVATQSCAGRPLAPDDAANLPPQFVSQPPVVLSELRDRQVEMEQEADMEQRKQQEAVTMRIQLLGRHEEWAEEEAMWRRDRSVWAQECAAKRQKTENIEIELQNAQAMVKRLQLQADTEQRKHGRSQTGTRNC